MLSHRSSIQNMSSQEIHINDINIYRVLHTNILGLILDKTLSWSYHVNYIQTKFLKSAPIISITRRNLPWLLRERLQLLNL